MDQDTVALAEHLDWTDARARPAEDVLREDRLGCGPEIARGYLGDEARDVDARRAADDAGCRRVRPTALEAAVRLDEGLRRSQRRAKLASKVICEATHVRSVRRRIPGAIGVSPDTIAGNPRVFRNRLRRRAEAAVALAVVRSARRGGKPHTRSPPSTSSRSSTATSSAV